MTAPLENPPRRFSPRVLVLISLLGLLLLTALALAWPSLRSFRAGQLAERSMQALRADDFDAASQSLQAALLIDPRHPNVMRAMSRIDAASGNPQALDILAVLEQRVPLNREDRLVKTQALLSAGNIEAASQLLESLRASPPAQDWLTLQANVLLAQGDIPGALAALTDAQRLAGPHSDRIRVTRWRVALRAGSPAQQASTLAEIRAHVADSSPTGLTAATILASFPSEDPLPLLRRIEKEAAPTDELQFLETALRIRADPSAQSQIIADLVKSYLPKPDDDRRKLALWLASHNLPDLALTLIPEDTQKPDLVLVRLDLLAALRRWSEIEKALNTDSSGIPEAVRRLFLARVYEQTNRSALVANQYELAVLATGDDVATTKYVASYLQKSGHDRLSATLWQKLADDPTQARSALEQLALLQRKNRQTADYVRTMTILSERWPMLSSYRLERIHLQLLLGSVHDDTERQQIETYLQTFQQTPFASVDQALSALQSGDSARAADALTRHPVPFASLGPGQQSVVAAVLMANGDERGAELAGKINPANLLPEEESLLQRYQR